MSFLCLVSSDLSVHAMRRAFVPLTQQLTCDQCKRMLITRVDQLTSEWIDIKVRISFVFPHLPIDGLDSDFPLSDNDLGS